jgi:hypothetical protein
MFMEEVLGDVLIGAIARAVDGCFNAMIELEEMLGLSPGFRGFTELPETLNSRKPPTDQGDSYDLGIQVIKNRTPLTSEMPDLVGLWKTF